MAGSQWYYMKSTMLGEEETGPISDKELLQLARDGKIKPQTAISSPTKTKGWVQASAVSALVKAYQEGMQHREEAKQRVKQEKQQLIDQRKQQVSDQRNQALTYARQISDDDRVDLVLKVAEQTRGVMTDEEKIDYIAIQKKLVAVTTQPDSVVLTNRRIIFYRAKVLGRFEFQDLLWLYVGRVDLSQQLMSSTLSVQAQNGAVFRMENINKESAQKLYRIAQHRTEQMIEIRRQRYMEEQRAGASNININQSAPMQSDSGMIDANPPVAAKPSLEDRLKKLKTLFENDLISESEFERRKLEILDEI